MAWFKCLCCCFCWIVSEKPNKNVDYQERLVVNLSHQEKKSFLPEKQDVLKDSGSGELSLNVLQSIEAWRQNVCKESSEDFIPALVEPIEPELYNERVWQWFDHFHRNVEIDFRYSQTIYQRSDLCVKKRITDGNHRYGLAARALKGTPHQNS